jgi:hypothetical protein
MRESYIEHKVCAFAKTLGWLAFKFASPGNAGVPDRLFLRDGCAIFVEFKAPGAKCTPMQLRQHERLRRYGFPTVVIDNVEDGVKFFEQISAAQIPNPRG